jgi:signal transduction histidine kinase
MARIVDLSDKDAKALADEAMKKGTKAGVIIRDGTDYAYQITQTSGEHSLIVFVDCTAADIMMDQLMQASLAVGAVSFLGFVVAITLLSRRAIRPVIKNAESQKRFITNAGHELKTPLAIISANTEVLEALNGQNEWTQSILTQVGRLTTLVGRLITLSKLGEQEKPVIQGFSVSELTELSVAAFHPLAQQQGKKLRWEVTPNLQLHSSEALVRELESILLDNAVKYCDDGGEIFLRLRPENHGCELYVSNDYTAGEGVDFSRFFERFYQEEQSHNSEKGGFGIGLSMAQEMVQTLRGTIRVEYREQKIAFRVGLSNLKKKNQN